MEVKFKFRQFLISENFETSNRYLKIVKAQVNKYAKTEQKISKVRQEKETHNNKEFPCEVCNKKYESSVKLNVHVKLDHHKTNSS
jgi:hypothetical protein